MASTRAHESPSESENRLREICTCMAQKRALESPSETGFRQDLFMPSHLPQLHTSSLPCHLPQPLTLTHAQSSPSPDTSWLPCHLPQPLTLTHAQSSPSTTHFFIHLFHTHSHLTHLNTFSLLSHHTIKISLLQYNTFCVKTIATLLSILHRKEKKQSTFYK